MCAASVSRMELLSKDNYDTWKMQMEALLIKNDAWDYANGVCAKPTADVFGEVKNVTLDNTLHVPDLRTNLLSVSKIADKGCEILFKKNHAIVFGADGDVKLIGDRVGDLYFVRVPRNSAFTSSNDNF
jgi:hypothetical protein